MPCQRSVLGVQSNVLSSCRDPSPPVVRLRGSGVSVSIVVQCIMTMPPREGSCTSASTSSVARRGACLFPCVDGGVDGERRRARVFGGIPSVPRGIDSGFVSHDRVPSRT